MCHGCWFSFVEKSKNILIAPDNLSPAAVEVPVLKVFDGDGFLTKFSLNESHLGKNGNCEPELVVRFGFIDAPELDQPGGLEAKEFLTSIIGGRKVWIDVLIKMDTGGPFDRYGRLVCVPYVLQNYSHCILKTALGHYHLAYQFGRSIDVARNIELEMVLNGWAWVLERYGPDERYRDALEDARSNKRGIWAYENNEHPWRFKARRAREKLRLAGHAARPERACPERGCRGVLEKRTDMFGEHVACSNYPRCRFFRPDTAPHR